MKFFIILRFLSLISVLHFHDVLAEPLSVFLRELAYFILTILKTILVLEAKANQDHCSHKYHILEQKGSVTELLQSIWTIFVNIWKSIHVTVIEGEILVTTNNETNETIINIP